MTTPKEPSAGNAFVGIRCLSDRAISSPCRGCFVVITVIDAVVLAPGCSGKMALGLHVQSFCLEAQSVYES